MDEKRFEGYDDELRESVLAFEQMRAGKKGIFLDSEQWLDIIEFYLEEGFIEDARQAWISGMAFFPHDEELKLREVYVLESEKEYKQALQVAEQMIPEHALFPDLHSALGSLYLRNGDVEASIAAFKKSIELDPEFEQAYIGLGNALEEGQYYEQAIEAYKKVVTLNPENDAAIYDLTTCYESMEQYSPAIAFLNEYLRQYPLSAAAWFNLGVCHSKEDSYKEAIEAYDFCLSIDPTYFSAYIFKSHCYSDNGEYESAIKILQQGIRYSQETAEFYIYIASCYERLNNWHAAMENYNQAIREGTRFADAWGGLARCQVELEQPQAAVASAKQSVKRAPKDFDVLLNAANVAWFSNSLSLAEDFFIEAIKASPTAGIPYLLLSELYFSIEKADEGVDILKRGLDNGVVPNDEYLAKICALLYLKGDKDAACTFLSSTLLSHPDIPKHLFDLCPSCAQDAQILAVISNPS